LLGVDLDLAIRGAAVFVVVGRNETLLADSDGADR
jgi:hypothetical protein